MAIPTADVGKFLAEHREFFEYMFEWRRSLPDLRMAEIIAGGNAVVTCVDLIKGFTTHGRLSSTRIAGIVPNVVRLFESAHSHGVRDFALLQDSHPEDSSQFAAFGPHCMKETDESETVDELARLPFAGEFVIMPKESLDPAAGTDFDAWLDSRPAHQVIVCGDCTDICVYLLAQHIATRGVAARRSYRVIVPANCVETYDLPVQAAKEIGATPHCADVLHLVFLWHMKLCGIEVVAKVV